MSPNKFMKWNPKKKNHRKDGPGISLKPEWFPVYQRLFLRGFRFLSCLHHSATREKSFYSRLRRSYLRPLADTEDSCRTQEKPQGTRMTTSFGGRSSLWTGSLSGGKNSKEREGNKNKRRQTRTREQENKNKRRQDKINYKPINNSFKNKVHYYITQMRFYRGTQRQFSEYIGRRFEI